MGYSNFQEYEGSLRLLSRLDERLEQKFEEIIYRTVKKDNFCFIYPQLIPTLPEPCISSYIMLVSPRKYYGSPARKFARDTVNRVQ